MSRLADKVAMITGGARGQGRSHALTFAREGAAVIVTDVCAPIPEVAPYEPATEVDLKETVRLVEEAGGRCLGIKVDARDSEGMREAVERGVAEFGRLDVLHVNHGVTAIREWSEQSDEVWGAVMDGCLNSAWRATRPAIPHLIEAGGGSIIFTSSAAGASSFVGVASYVAAKHGLIGLMRALSAELAPYLIRVNAILPANCATDMLHSQALMDLFAGHENATVDDTRFPSQSMLLLPVPWIEAQDVSDAALFLASDESRYITGISLPVDAGALNQPPGIPPTASERLAALKGRRSGNESD